MKNISFLSENFQFLEVKFSIYFNRRVFVRERLGNPVILAGEFNLIFDTSVDTLCYRNVNNPQVRNKVIEVITDCGLIDCWRELNAKKLSFIWTRPNSNKRARLDYILTSEECFSDIDDANILPG